MVLLTSVQRSFDISTSNIFLPTQKGQTSLHILPLFPFIITLQIIKHLITPQKNIRTCPGGAINYPRGANPKFCGGPALSVCRTLQPSALRAEYARPSTGGRISEIKQSCNKLNCLKIKSIRFSLQVLKVLLKVQPQLVVKLGLSTF